MHQRRSVPEPQPPRGQLSMDPFVAIVLTLIVTWVAWIVWMEIKP